MSWDNVLILSNHKTLFQKFLKFEPLSANQNISKMNQSKNSITVFQKVLAFREKKEYEKY